MESQPTIDFTPVRAGELYGPLQDPQLFRHVRLDPEVDTLVWPNFDPATLNGWSLVVQTITACARAWASSHASRGRLHTSLLGISACLASGAAMCRVRALEQSLVSSSESGVAKRKNSTV